MSDHIAITLENNIQTIKIQRLEKKNALTNDMYLAMSDALDASNSDDNIKVNILCGEEGCFTAGNDIKDFLAIAMKGAVPDGIIKFLTSLGSTEKPLILTIDGLAVGIGTTMCFHADLVYATRHSTFTTPFADLGLIPEAASSYLMPKTMGYARAYEMLVLGNSFTAEEAKQAGFVNDIFESENLQFECQQIAERLAAKPAQAIKIAKSLMRGDRETIMKVMHKESELFSERLQSDEARNAFTAFLSK